MFPSAVAASPIEEMTLSESIMVMCANKNFMILTMAYAFIYGIYCAVGSTISNLLNPFGYSPTEISIAGGSCMLSGVIGALLVAIFVDHTAWYRKTHLSLSFLILCSVITIYVVLHWAQGELSPVIASCVMFGVSGVSYFPISLSYGAELTFPLQPALVNACMNFFGQVCAFFMIGVSALVTDVNIEEMDSMDNNTEERQNSSYFVTIIFCFFSLITLVLAYFIKEDLRRVNFKLEEHYGNYADETLPLGSR